MPAVPIVPTPRRRAAARALTGLLLALVLVLAIGPLAVGAQTGPSGTPTTSSNLVVGTTTTVTPAASTTTTAPPVSVDQARKRANDDTRRVWYIVAALLGVALLLLILTVRYWVTTRPGRELSPRQARRRGDADQDTDSGGPRSADPATAGDTAPAPAPPAKTRGATVVLPQATKAVPPTIEPKRDGGRRSRGRHARRDDDDR